MPRPASTLASLAALSALRAASASIPTLTLSYTAGSAPVQIPRVLLGTGGGGGGYDAGLWLRAGGPGFDSAYTYCYNSAAPFCSHVAIWQALQEARLAPNATFIISKIEPASAAPLEPPAARPTHL